MTIGVTAKLIVQEGKNAEFEDIFTRLVEAVNTNESGCDFYQFFKMRSQENTYMVLEQYVDEAAFTIHRKSDYSSISSALGNVMAAEPEIEIMDSV